MWKALSKRQESSESQCLRERDATKIFNSEESWEAPRECSGISQCFFSCLFSSDHNNCSGWATALQPNPLTDYTDAAGGSTRGREIKKKEGEKGTCFLQVVFGLVVFFFFLLRELVRWEWEAETLEDKAPSDQIR